MGGECNGKTGSNGLKGATRRVNPRYMSKLREIYDGASRRARCRPLTLTSLLRPKRTFILQPTTKTDKMAPVKKSKSAKSSENINSKLQLVVKSGKVSVAQCWSRCESCGALE